MARKSVDLTTLAGWAALSSGTHNITIVAKANGFKDSAPSAAVQVEKVTTYTITPTLTNVTGDSSNPTTIQGGSTATLHFTANSGYQLPDSVTVTGATSSWDKTTGILTLSNPTGNVTFSVVGEQAGITDLTGYIWRPNTTITLPPAPEDTYAYTTAYASLTATCSKGSFSVPGNNYGFQFGWDSTYNRYNWLMFTDSVNQKNAITYYWNYNSHTGWYGIINNGAESKVTNVSITFKENANVPTSFMTFDAFVSWLKANGTLTKS